MRVGPCKSQVERVNCNPSDRLEAGCLYHDSETDSVHWKADVQVQLASNTSQSKWPCVDGQSKANHDWLSF